MRKNYLVTINGHIDFPGEYVELESPTPPSFDWRSWEFDLQGVEFDLPSSLFNKPYQLDDFEIEVTDLALNTMIREGCLINLGISEADASILRLYIIDCNFYGVRPFVWIKHIKMVLYNDPTGTVGVEDWTVDIELASEAIASNQEHDTMQLYYSEAEGMQRYVLTKYAKTYVGAKVRVWEEDSSHSSGYRLKFAGRISEEPTLTQPGVFHFIAKDELEWLDVKTPAKDIGLSSLDSLWQYLNPTRKLTTGFASTDVCVWKGDIAELTNINDTLASINDYSKSYFTDGGGYDNFRDAWVDYLKLSRKIITLTQTSGANSEEPLYEIIDFDIELVSTGSVDLISQLGS